SPAVHLDPTQALGATSLAASDNWVFWADGALIRVDTTSGGTTGTVTNVADIARVAVGLSGVYAQRTTEVWRTAPDGSNPELFIPNLTAVSNLSAQAGLVVASDNKGSQGAERVVGRGEQLPSERIYATAEGRVTAVSADAKYVYWADTASGSIRRRAR
ncbi:MAG: hypothetical protein KC492_03140, partial [Myxococcales bacterium]|nr:hypothetical protein [Myxococcales bacterium]